MTNEEAENKKHLQNIFEPMSFLIFSLQNRGTSWISAHPCLSSTCPKPRRNRETGETGAASQGSVTPTPGSRNRKKSKLGVVWSWELDEHRTRRTHRTPANLSSAPSEQCFFLVLDTWRQTYIPTRSFRGVSLAYREVFSFQLLARVVTQGFFRQQV